MKRRRQEPTASGDGELRPDSARWTGGPAIAARAFTWLLVAVVLVSPALAGWLLWERHQAANAPVVEMESVDLSGSVLAGETGRELVEAWLAASREDSAALEAVFPGGAPTVPAVAWPSRGVSVSSVTETGEGTWSVVVAADVAEPVLDAEVDEGDEPERGWVRRFYQVPVVVAATDQGFGARATALPAPVARPGLLDLAGEYRRDVAASGVLAETINGFLAAYLAGQGDIDRYLSPGAVVVPVNPPAYAAAQVAQIRAAAAFDDSEAPADGDQLTVLVTADVTRADDDQQTTQFLLDLTARASRWEVTEISMNPTTRPAGATTEGDN